MLIRLEIGRADRKVDHILAAPQQRLLFLIQLIKDIALGALAGFDKLHCFSSSH